MVSADLEKIRNVMSTDVICVDEKATAEDVATLFNRKNISGAPVLGADGMYVGTITRTDLLGRQVLQALRNRRPLASVLVKDIMTPTLHAIPPTARLIDAVNLMAEKKVHRVFVVDDTDQVVGVVSAFDLVAVIQKSTSETASSGNSEPQDKKSYTSLAGSSSSSSKKKEEAPEKKGKIELRDLIGLSPRKGSYQLKSDLRNAINKGR